MRPDPVRKGAMMIELLILLAIAAIAPQIFPGIKVKSLGTAALVAVVFAMINFFLGWLLTLVLTIVSIPAIILTLGAFTVFIPTLVNAILLRMVDAVLEDFDSKPANVREGHVRPATGEGTHSCPLQQGLPGTGTRAPADVATHILRDAVRVGMSRKHEANGIVADRLGNNHLVEDRTQLQQLRTIGNRRHLGRLPQDRPVHHLAEFLAAKEGNCGLEHETVELCFRQRVRPFLLDGILRGQHHKGRL